MNNYLEDNIFPNGLYVDYYTDISTDYIKELGGIKYDEDLQNFRKKWNDILPELDQNVNIDDIIFYRGNLPGQDDLVNKAINGCQKSYIIINYLVPRTLFILTAKSGYFGVPEGTVLLQFYNSGKINVTDGKWRINFHC